MIECDSLEWAIVSLEILDRVTEPWRSDVMRRYRLFVGLEAWEQAIDQGCEFVLEKT